MCPQIKCLQPLQSTKLGATFVTAERCPYHERYAINIIRGAKQLGHGEGYKYAHNHDDGIATFDYLGVDKQYYNPVNRGFEAELSRRLEEIRKNCERQYIAHLVMMSVCNNLPSLADGYLTTGTQNVIDIPGIHWIELDAT